MNIKSLLDNPIIVKYKLLIFPVVTVLISLGLLIFLIIPQIASGFELQKQIHDAQAKADLLTKKNSELEKIDASSYQDNVKTTLIAIPQDKDVSGVVGQILFFVRSNQLTIVNVGFGTTAAENGIQSFQIRLETQGDLADVKKFMSDIKNAPRILRITGIEITGNRSSTRVQSALTLTTYFQPLPAVIGKVDQALTAPTPKDLELLTVLKNNLNTVPVINSEDATGPQGKADPFQ